MSANYIPRLYKSHFYPTPLRHVILGGNERETMRKNCLLLLFIASALAIPPCSATETRVDSTGGLSLVMTDESAHVDPFVFGNPAGLALLSPQNRLDYSYEWFQQTSAYFNTQSFLYGTLGELN